MGAIDFICAQQPSSRNERNDARNERNDATSAISATMQQAQQAQQARNNCAQWPSRGAPVVLVRPVGGVVVAVLVGGPRVRVTLRHLRQGPATGLLRRSALEHPALEHPALEHPALEHPALEHPATLLRD
jgi:hypothetical protein